MNLSNYTKSDEHIKHHKIAIEFINNISPEKIIKNPLKEVKELKLWLQNYVFEHILGHDTKLIQELGEDKIKELEKLL